MVEIKNDEKEQVIGKYKQIWMNTINSHINGSSIASVIELPEYTVEDNLILNEYLSDAKQTDDEEKETSALAYCLLNRQAFLKMKENNPTSELKFLVLGAN